MTTDTLLRDYQRKARDLAEVERAITERERHRYSLGDAVEAAHFGKPDQAPMARDLSEAIAAAVGLPPAGPHEFYISARLLDAMLDHHGLLRRDLGTTPGSAGGFLVNTSVPDTILDALRPMSVVLTLGAQAMSFDRAAVAVPRINTASTATWLSSETAPAATTQPVLGAVAMAPKTVAAHTQISRQFSKQAGARGDRLIAQDLAAVVGTALDRAAIQGTGASGQPLGILNTSGIGSVSGTTLNKSGLTEMQRIVATANGIRSPQSCGYIAPPATAETLSNRAVVASSDRFAWEGALTDGNAAGHRAIATTNVPPATVLFGDWSSLIVGTWGVLRVQVHPFSNFPAGIVAARIMLDCDIGMRSASCFAAASSVT
jgi:HK97 family phage major capsid protein